MTQLEIAELFQTTKQNVSLHAKILFNDGELGSESVVKESLATATDGKNYRTQLYNLDLILAIGYRVRSPRGTQFRQSATAHLREFIVKGFIMDDERLKNPGGWDHFDELLARIREIRASEKRFYQKVRDLFALSRPVRAECGLQDARTGNDAVLRRGAEQTPLCSHPPCPLRFLQSPIPSRSTACTAVLWGFDGLMIDGCGAFFLSRFSKGWFVWVVLGRAALGRMAPLRGMFEASGLRIL